MPLTISYPSLLWTAVYLAFSIVDQLTVLNILWLGNNNLFAFTLVIVLEASSVLETQ